MHNVIVWLVAHSALISTITPVLLIFLHMDKICNWTQSAFFNIVDFTSHVFGKAAAEDIKELVDAADKGVHAGDVKK
jgi:hypothetical protein